MANYQSRVQVTLANRRAAYQGIAAFFLHLDALDVTCTSLVYNGTTKHIDIITTTPIPAEQHEHLGIQEVI